MSYAVTERGDIAILVVGVERLDASQASSFKQAALEVLDRGFARFVVDLSQVTFIDSSGLSALLSLRKNIDPSGAVVLAGAQSPKVQQLFRVTKLDKGVFPMHENVEQAVAALSGEG
ncbi:anti-sigma F factor antagonist [Halorhodospira halochloris]|uniref:Anti-sigma F factor antagonist n=1 Tax=Halorhodospira halochloris TaxID=1052 RepID=A0A110B498_HALHR|nr:STAS domain-containing protein [Halorhodospira halochloris]MBK1651031.1 anti-anti-sigma factor [Halorhodospira halochloris]MCG5547373.1 STAS domain-containing protein [Halorhodospira halochloris]BAU56456.1 anti-sigma F factor antagonist [Halorhodospira halochloris]